MSTRLGRQTIYVPKDEEAPLRRLLALKGEENMSSAVNSISARYLEIICHSVPKAFTEQDLCFLFDIFKSPWTPELNGVKGMEEEIGHAIKFDQMDQKWRVDGQHILTKMRRLNYAEKMAIVEMSEAFWKTEADQPYDQVIRYLKERLRPTQAYNTLTRPNRLNRELLPSLSGLSGTEVEHSAVNEEVEEFRVADKTARSPHPFELQIGESSATPEPEITSGPTDMLESLASATQEVGSTTSARNPGREEEAPRLDLGVE